MARKNVPALQQLLDACRKAGSVTRKAWRVRTKRPAVKLSAADRKEKRLRWLEKKTTYNAAINEIHQQLRDAAAEVHSQFPDHTLERVITDVFQSQRLKDSSKDISRYSVFTSLQMQILNANTPEGQPRQKVNQLSHIIAEKWRGMTEEERVAVTEDEIVVLRERKENKELGMWHNTDISATHDSSMTVSRVKEELTRLAARTGNECILVVTRGSLSRFRPPETYCSSEKSESFLSTVMKTSGADLAMRMDAFMVLGVEGVARNHVQILTEMKSKVSALILQKLKQCAGKYEVKKMFYTNFEEHVTRPFGIVVKNWPLKEFKNPSSISTRADVSILWNAWETGTAHFYMMTHEEHQAWEQKQDKALVEAQGRLQGVREKHAAEQITQEEDHSREEEDVPAGDRGEEGSPPAANPPHAGEGNPSSTPTTTFVHATVVTDASGVAVHSHSRTRKKRSDAGKPRKKRKTNVSGSQEGSTEA
ncbi:hypothetical protein F5051DRAFT_446296 [Lentinula edodes]|nr:hypothetical protein F5051DRAFT_446296 [Lentinula edodes]